MKVATKHVTQTVYDMDHGEMVKFLTTGSALNVPEGAEVELSVRHGGDCRVVVTDTREGEFDA